jgi:RNA polymerase sigma-70 factor (ECF subfamily)
MPQSPASTDWSALRGGLWKAAIALTRSREDAEDLTQQTFAAVLARRPECIEHVGYVRQTMFRLWLDEQRSVRRRLRRLARLAQWSAMGRRDRDADADGELRNHLHRAIEALPPLQHAVAVLRLVDELSYEEIAATLECSVETVRANLHLARKRMRQSLGEEP